MKTPSLEESSTHPRPVAALAEEVEEEVEAQPEEAEELLVEEGTPHRMDHEEERNHHPRRVVGELEPKLRRIKAGRRSRREEGNLLLLSREETPSRTSIQILSLPPQATTILPTRTRTRTTMIQGAISIRSRTRFRRVFLLLQRRRQQQ